MSEKTQKTPQGEEIPVPKRGDFLKNLGKIAKREKPERDEGSAPSSTEK